MRPSPLSLAATVTYHRIILISRGKTAGGSWPSSPTFLHFPRPRRSRRPLSGSKKEPVTPTRGGVDGGWPLRLNPPRPAFIPRFPGSRGRPTRRPRKRAKSESALPIRAIAGPFRGCFRSCANYTAFAYEGIAPADFEKSDDRRVDEIRFRSSSFFRKKKEKRNGIEVFYRNAKREGVHRSRSTTW